MTTVVKSGPGLINYWIANCSRELYHHITKMEQMLEHVMELLNAMQERMETQIRSLASQVYQAKIEANNEKPEVLRNVDQARRDEGHAGGLSRKNGGKSRKIEVRSEASGRPSR
jgi:outer membrane murein-binding lipoprotein Lpp